MRRVPLPSEGLYPLLTLARAQVLIYGARHLAARLRGSWPSSWLASWSATGGHRTRREIERFHSALASLAEIVAFVVLGLTVSLSTIYTGDVLVVRDWSSAVLLHAGRAAACWSGCCCCRSG